MNGMIAIMKDIEKSQTKPTVAMLYSLFEQIEAPKKQLILEKKSFEQKKHFAVDKLRNENKKFEN